MERISQDPEVRKKMDKKSRAIERERERATVALTDIRQRTRVSLLFDRY